MNTASAPPSSHVDAIMRMVTRDPSMLALAIVYTGACIVSLLYMHDSADRVIDALSGPHAAREALVIQARFARTYIIASLSGFAVLGGLVKLLSVRMRRRNRGCGCPAAATQPDSVPAAHSHLHLAWMFALLLLAFAVDVFIPVGPMAIFMYVAIVLLSTHSAHPAHVWIAAGSAMALTVLQVLIRFDAVISSSDMWDILASRTLTVFTLWTVALLGQGLKRALSARNAARASAENTQQANTQLTTLLADCEEVQAQVRHDQQIMDAIAALGQIGAWEFEVATNTLTWSKEVCRIREVPEDHSPSGPEEALQFYPPPARRLIEDAFRKAIDEGIPFDLTLPFVTARGRSKWIRAMAGIERVDGATKRVYGAFQDITELHEARSRLARTSRSASEGHWEHDLAADTVWLSPTFQELLGFEAAEKTVSWPTFRRLFHRDDLRPTRAAFRSHLETGAPFAVEVHLRSACGEWRWFRIRGAVERDAENNVIRSGGTCCDIEREKQAQDELRQVRARLERAVHGTQDGLWEQNLSECRLWVSQRFCELLGYEDSKLPEHEKLFSQLLHPDDVARFEGEKRAHLQDGAPFDIDVRLRNCRGEYRWFCVRASAESDATHTPITLSGSIRDITQQRETEQALLAATETATAASRVKSEFLANMSHEIRTPMNGVLGMTELLLDTRLDPVQREFAETIRSSASNLLNILNDILDVSKIEAGKLHLERIEMELHNCVEDVGAALAVQAAAKNLEFIVDVSPLVPERVHGDPHRLRQVLMNLCSNAIKFTERGEVAVQVRVASSAGRRVAIEFEVRDSGIGMSPQAQARLFQPFMQADTSTTRRFGGTGLGLSIVRQLVALMGGEIRVSSAPDAGTTFAFELCFDVVSTIGAGAAAASARFGRKRILIIDDNATTRRVLRGQLQTSGYTVATAAGRDEALEMLDRQLSQGQPFDLVIADGELPDGDPAKLGTRIRERSAEHDVRLIILSSLERSGEAARLDQLGFDGYLIKPVRSRELLACVIRVLERDARTTATGLHSMVTRGSLHAAQGHRYQATVLVVEDNPVNQQVARRFLERLGCEVTVVGDGAAAVEICAAHDFDLVLMDVHMPVMDGLTATREIRGREGTGRRTPIVALTASAMKQEVERCLTAGMDDLLLKPIESTRLRAILDRFATALPEQRGEPGEGTPVAPSGGPFEMEKLRALTGEDSQFMAELYRTFISSSLSTMQQLEQALGEGDYGRFAALAHQLKGTSASVYASTLYRLAAQLECGAHQSSSQLSVTLRAARAALEECAREGAAFGVAAASTVAVAAAAS